MTAASSSDLEPMPSQTRNSGVILGAVAILWALYLIKGAIDTGFGTLTNPGAGLWPAIVAVGTILVAVSLFAPSTGEHQAGEDDADVDSPPRLFLAALLILLFGAVLLNFAGLLISTVLAVFVWCLVIGRKTVRYAVLVALGTGVSVHVIFSTLLRVPYPGF